ncbi:hypothetical protein [Salinisphaera sp. S4-8]|uniref:hypothetical protein n=1 Tax=Salinisphaera sp. S4-8 TaxID=633357 RepID=UPI0033426878
MGHLLSADLHGSSGLIERERAGRLQVSDRAASVFLENNPQISQITQIEDRSSAGGVATKRIETT